MQTTGSEVLIIFVVNKKGLNRQILLSRMSVNINEFRSPHHTGDSPNLNLGKLIIEGSGLKMRDILNFLLPSFINT